MNSEIVNLRFIRVQNCFLHLSKDVYDKLIGPSVCGLKLVTSEGKEFYFSSFSVPYSGLQINSIGLSNKYAKDLELKENEEIILSPIYNIGSINSVNVLPVSEDDFEIIYSSSTEVENSLLNQLRIIWPKQIFPVWISKNVTVDLIVDSVSPSLKFGRIEEYTEVVVCDAVKKNVLNKGQSSELCYSVIPSNNNMKENLPISRTLKFRCVPVESFSHLQIFNSHPYVVFASEESIPLWACSIIKSNKKAVWKLKKIGDEFSYLVVNLLIPEQNGHGNIHNCNFNNLFLSNTVRCHLGIDLGTKVSLDLVEDKGVEIIGILISPRFDVKDNSALIADVRDSFTQAVSQHKCLLLNTKSSFPLKQGNIVVTLRPLQVEWSFIDLKSIKDLSINLNEYNQSEQDSASNYVLDDCKVADYFINCEELISKGKMAIEISLALHAVKSYRFYDNIIYVGKMGSGKTSLVNFLLQKIKGPPFYIYSKGINCCTLKGKRIEILNKYVTELIKKCTEHEPSVLFLDDLDLLAVSMDDVSEQAFHLMRITNKLVELIESYQAKHFFIVIATAKSMDNINTKIFSKQGKSLFTSVIDIPDLSKDDRLDFLKNMVIKLSGCQLFCDLNLMDIISNCEGFTPLDLKRLAEKAVFEAWQRKVQFGGDLILKSEDLETALENTKPSSLQNVNLHKGANKCWLNVGGLEDVKVKLMEVICWSTMYPDIMKQCPIKPQTGILLYGAPGTGKTLIASALAGESKMNFISIKGPELMSKYIGESEEGIRKLFEKAQSAKPCLLFFDEFDSLAPRRGQDQTGVTDRVVNQLLTALDGIDILSGVWVIAATSRPDLIDPAILRPGRIGISIFCPVPDEDGRLAILKVLCKKISLSSEVNLEEIADRTAGFTGADLRGLLTSAQLKRLDLLEDDGSLFSEENLSKKPEKRIEVTRDCLMSAINDMKPSLTPNEKMRYENIYGKFEKKIPMDLTQPKVTHA